MKTVVALLVTGVMLAGCGGKSTSPGDAATTADARADATGGEDRANGGSTAGRGGSAAGATGGVAGATGGATGVTGGAAGRGGSTGTGGLGGSPPDASAADASSVDAGSDRPALDAPPADGTGADANADQANADGGADGGVVVPPWTGAAPLQLTTDKALELIVAKDERHLAYSTNRADSTAFGCLGRNAVGELETLVTDPLPAVSATIDTYAGFRESMFTDDGQTIVFTQYTRGTNPCSDRVNLRYAPSSGGTSQSLSSGITYYFHDISVLGSTALWRGFGGSASDLGTRGVRKIGAAGSASGMTLGSGNLLETDPTGSFVLDDRNSQLLISSLTSTTKVVLNDGTLGTNVRWAWSPDGARLGYAHRLTSTDPIALELVASDGSARTALAATCRCSALAFSPDGGHLAYDINETDGSVSYVLAASTAAATSAKLTGLPANAGAPKWSANGKWLEVSTADGVLWVGPTAGGAFVRLTATGARKGNLGAWSPDQGFLAFNELDAANAAALVVATPAGARSTPIASGVYGLWYESAAPSRLAVAATAPGTGATTMYILPPDGSSTGIALRTPPVPGYAMAFWIGRTLVYATNLHSVSGTSVMDLVAARDDGSQEGLLATDVSIPPKAGRPAPTRLFFVRAPVSGGGIYMFAPPTP